MVRIPNRPCKYIDVILVSILMWYLHTGYCKMNNNNIITFSNPFLLSWLKAFIDLDIVISDCIIVLKVSTYILYFIIISLSIQLIISIWSYTYIPIHPMKCILPISYRWDILSHLIIRQLSLQLKQLSN